MLSSFFRPRSRPAVRDRAGEAGFTLIEMLVVLAIIGMISALVGPQVIKYLGRAKVDSARVEIQSLETALDLFRLDIGRYPNEQEGLTSLVQKPANLASWNGPYVKKKAAPMDPWGQPYVYRFPGKQGAYDLYSRGPDANGAGTTTN
jgi:general secretion pathway protein G